MFLTAVTMVLTNLPSIAQDSTDCEAIPQVAPQSDPQPGPYTSMNVPASDEDGVAQMEKVIRADFAYWTGGLDTLTMREVGKLERDPDIKGQQAAALGIIAQSMVGRIKTDCGREPQYTMEELLTALNGNSKRGRHFQTAMKELATTTGRGDRLRLYGASGEPSVDDIHQGAVGDCYALSAIEALMHVTGPEPIKQMIQTHGGNRYTVSFPGADPVDLQLTQAEIAQGNLNPDNGCWLQLLGLAIDKLRAAHHQKAHSAVRRTKQEQYAQTPMGWLSHGGSQPAVFQWLTGERFRKINRKSDQWDERTVARILTMASQAGAPMGTCTADHCLCVWDWDPQARMVTVMNPWGSNQEYSPNGAKKFMMTDGKFTLPLAEYLADFRTLTVPESLFSKSDK